ncbi:phenylalanine--tRNA ligase subunit beta [Brachybacterium sp. AOP25-B2-12]|uniref:phenylalanine--tRNA ligase subunit beta n=1 Tax=Brachybacterium sp. AOP25-B2-12 TaxID=3457710 RepID=UPI004034EF35
MPRIPLSWIGEHTPLADGADAEAVAAALVSVGLEEEAIFGAQVTGPLVVGRVLDLVKEPQKNGKTINWCRVDVGPAHDVEADDPKDPQPGPERPSRGIICGAHNFVAGDLVVVALPGTVLPGPFPIAARKTYGHTSDGMICSTAELGLGEGTADEEHGIIVLGKGTAEGLTAEPGDDAISLLGLGEEVVEINVTPDRGYAFSMRGVAREYSHATGQPFTDPADREEVTAGEGAVAVELADDAPLRGRPGSSRFVALGVHGIDPQAPSPRWLQQRLILAGMRPISLVVDVTNYVMLDLGQPLHAYDAALLTGPIVVRRAGTGETLETLDDAVRTLDVEDLLITDQAGSRPIGIAGVMGGASTEVSANTTDIVLEAATFDPVTIARSARRHRLPSEASRRFERGVDPALPGIAVLRAAQLIVEHGGGTIDTVATDARLEDAPGTARAIRLGVRDAELLVGIPYTRAQVIDSLTEVGALVSTDGDDALLVEPPSWRPDLLTREDLIEEIARLVGYEKIPSLVPRAPGGHGLTRAQRGRRAALTALAEAGLVEVISSPFVPAGVFDEHRYAEDDPRRAAVRLRNPLADDAPLLRTALLQSLLPVARRNLGRGQESVAVFELGTSVLARPGRPSVPIPSAASLPDPEQLAAIDAALPVQTRRIAAVVGGAQGTDSWWGTAETWGWSDAIDLARRVATAVGAEIEVIAEVSAPFHPGRAAALWATTSDGDRLLVGHAGELHPRVVVDLALPPRTSALEVDIDALVAAAPPVIPAEPVVTFPLAKEDLAFVVEDSVPSAAVEAAIVAGIGDDLESVHLFDVYTGEQVGQGHRSLAYAVRLRSAEGTLTAEQITAARQRAVAAVGTATGGTLRA